MITKKAIKLKVEHDKEYVLKKRCLAADKLFNEIIKNCKPTKKEFFNLMNNTTFTPAPVWEICKRIWKWGEK